MATQVQFRGGTTTEHASFNGAAREVTVDTTKQTLVVQDGTTNGGFPLLRQDLNNLPAGTIDNADINASAAIAGTKIAPDFGSQDVKTTGLLEIASGSCHIDLMETSATNHRIRNGSGNFHIQKISDDKGTVETQLLIDGGTGAVKLYHAGSSNPKLETASDKILFYGHAKVNDDATYDIGASGARWKDLFISGTATINADPSGGANQGIELSTSGYIEACNTEDAYYLWKGYKQGSSSLTSSIRVDGRADFKEAIITLNSNDTSFTDLSLPASVAGGIAAQNLQGVNGAFSAVSLVAGNANAVSQSASIIAKSVNPGYAPEIHFTQRTGSNANTTALKINNNQNVEITAGDLVIANGHGIDFSLSSDTATGETTDSQLLDDYEEGQWEPLVSSGGSTQFTHNHARYVKVGNFVHLDFDITNNSGGGINTVYGLPFTPIAYSGWQIGWLSTSSGTTQGASNDQGGYVDTNGYLSLRVAGGNDSSTLSDGQRFIGSASYRTAT